jgi:hypothetical protein
MPGLSTHSCSWATAEAQTRLRARFCLGREAFAPSRFLSEQPGRSCTTGRSAGTFAPRTRTLVLGASPGSFEDNVEASHDTCATCQRCRKTFRVGVALWQCDHAAHLSSAFDFPTRAGRFVWFATTRVFTFTWRRVRDGIHRADVCAAATPVSGRRLGWSERELHTVIRPRIAVVRSFHVTGSRAWRRVAPRVPPVWLQDDDRVVVATFGKPTARQKADVHILANTELALHMNRDGFGLRTARPHPRSGRHSRRHQGASGEKRAHAGPRHSDQSDRQDRMVHRSVGLLGSPTPSGCSPAPPGDRVP